jgi:hypothetical protein
MLCSSSSLVRKEEADADADRATNLRLIWKEKNFCCLLLVK